jgi:hypothetical protein
MSVIRNKLIPVDYDANGTTDLGFFRSFTEPNPNSSQPTIQGELAVWLLIPSTSLPLGDSLGFVGAVVDEKFPYANGNFNLLGDGFVPGFNFQLPSSPFVPDFNGDGKTDQVFGSLAFQGTTFAGFELATWFMNGLREPLNLFITDSGGSSPAVVPINAGVPPTKYVDLTTGRSAIGGEGPLADFNGDGTTDILVLEDDLSASLRNIEVWIVENGVNTLQQSLPSVDPGIWDIVNVNDLDGNGSNDLIFANFDSSTGSTVYASWLLDNNGNYISGQVIDIAPQGWGLIDTNDFDGDGGADLLFAKQNTDGSSQYGVWLVGNDGRVESVQDFGSIQEAGWEVLDHNDFNGDGIADLLFKNENGIDEDLYGVWLLNGSGGFIDRKLVGAISDSSGYEYLNSGDYSGDGKADLAFVENSAKEVGLWVMNGVNPISRFVLGQYTQYPSPEDWNAPFQQPTLSFPPDSTTPPLSPTFT